MSVDQEQQRIASAESQPFVGADASDHRDDLTNPPTLTELPLVQDEGIYTGGDDAYSADDVSPPYDTMSENDGGWRPMRRADLQSAPSASRLYERPSSVRGALALGASQAPRKPAAQKQQTGEGWSRSQKIVAAGLSVAGAAALAVGMSMFASSNAEHPGVPVAASSSPTPGAGASEFASPPASPLPSPSLFGIELAPVPTTPVSNALGSIPLTWETGDPCDGINGNLVEAAINDLSSALGIDTCNATPTSDTYFSESFSANDGTQVTIRLMDDAALGAESQIITAADGTKTLKGPGDFAQLLQVYGDNERYALQGMIADTRITTYGDTQSEQQYTALQFNQSDGSHEIVVNVLGSDGADHDFILNFFDPKQLGEYNMSDPSNLGSVGGTAGNQLANLVLSVDYTMLNNPVPTP